MTAPKVLLVGMMGAGKTTVGTALAAALGWHLLDSDAEVIASTGRSIPEIFEHEGEAAFRSHEARVLREAMASADPSVVAVAGGAVLSAENRELIAGADLVAWLRAPAEVLAGRVGAGEGRPLLGDDPAAAIARLYPERLPLYEQLADVVVDVGEGGPAAAVESILAALRSRGITAGGS